MKPGQKLGPYEIISALGSGGMGDVYKARDTRLNRDVAIKISKDAFTDRFLREARAVAALNHPHVCTLFDIGPNYLVMELLDGKQLAGPLPQETAVKYALQILSALEAAHRKTITHRDLKPANIIVTKQGIKLVDFGIAKQAIAIDGTDDTLTADGAIAGTLQYMSPEQLQNKQIDGRSDLFSFGCVFYEMLSGKQAFHGDSAASLIAAVLDREPEVIDAAPPLGEIIAGCLMKNSDERFQTATDLARALRIAAGPQADTPPRRSKAKPWLYAAAGVVAGFLIGFGPTRFVQTPAAGRSMHFTIQAPRGGVILNHNLALSPSGHSIVFAARVKNTNSLWMQALDSKEARLLPGTEDGVFPFWSPDEKSIGYFAGGKLWRLDLNGAAPRPICESGVGRGGAWSRDGTIIFSSHVGSLRRVSAAGGTPAPLAELDHSKGEMAHYFPVMVDDRRFVYFSLATPTENSAIFAGNLDVPNARVKVTPSLNAVAFSLGQLLMLRGSVLEAHPFDTGAGIVRGEPVPLVSEIGTGSSIAGKLPLAASNADVIVYAESSSALQFSWFDRKGTLLDAAGPPAHYVSFGLSRNGHRAVIAKARRGGNDLWTVDLDSNVWNRFTFGGGINAFPVWAPDDRTIVFRSGTPPNLFRKPTAGSGEPQRILSSPSAQLATDWSADGKLIAYSQAEPGRQQDIWLQPVRPDGAAEIGAKKIPFAQSAANESEARFFPAPSPNWMVYQSDESGQSEIYVQSFPEGKGKWQISSDGGTYPSWTPDGKEIFYLSRTGALTSVRVNIAGGAIEKSQPEKLFDLPIEYTIAGIPYAIAPDGKRILVRGIDDSVSPPLHVITNWPALLKRNAAQK